jgi:hypothetical protein
MAALAAIASTSLGRAADPTVTMFGKPVYFHLHHVEVPGVPETEQADYQGSWAGEIGLRIAGLKDEPHRVRLEYTEMDMNAPRTRVFDILINDQVVKKEVCIFTAVGNRRVLAFDFPATPRNGEITYFQRKSVPSADSPSFTVIKVFDASGRLVARCSAHDLKPSDWEQRDYLDEIYHPPFPNNHTSPPWAGSYKLRTDRPSSLTAADVAGPDGIVYPDWTNVGIRGGIPSLANTLSAAAFDVRPGLEGDSSAALQKAIDALQAAGGGVLFIPAGRYYLDRPVFVTGDRCVLRGAGSRKTRFVSRFSMTGLSPQFIGILPGAQVGPSTPVTVWVDPKGLTGFSLAAGGKVILSGSRPGIWETNVQYALPGRTLLAAAGPGPTELRITVVYRDGTSRTASLPIRLTREEAASIRPSGPLGMINFLGSGARGAPRIRLAADGNRGDMSLLIAPGHALKSGDRIQLVGPETPRWGSVLRTNKRNGYFRANEYEIAGVDGARISLPEALRIAFPVEDGSFIQRIRPLVRSGVEDLGLEQVVPTQVHGIVFSYGWECWARGLEISKAGDKALYMPESKRCEVRDCTLDRSWCNDGGSAYVGWESSYDCLMEHVTTFDMRHAPVLQWASSGNVIRSSVFHGSDAQWHAGWTNENLYEDLVVESSQVTGAYGNGGWASGPDDTAHGPNGPRNVVYNCDISSTKVGLWLGGMNENWLILNNRFVVGRGPAVFAKDASFDHIIRGNVFVMLEPRPAAVYLETPDCTGIEFSGNRFYGPVSRLFGGAIAPAVDEDNRVRASGGISRPRPAVRSIFEWEQSHRGEIRAQAAARAAVREEARPAQPPGL